MAAHDAGRDTRRGSADARRRRWWPILRWLAGLALAGLAIDVLLGRSGELSGAAASLSRAAPLWIVAAVAAEAASMACFAYAQRRLLREGGARLPVRTVLAVVLAGNAVTNSLPAGPAFGTAYSWRLLRRRGVGEVLAGWALVALGVIATATLAVLASLGVAAALGQGTALGLVSVTVGTVLGAGVAIAVLRRPDVLSGVAGAGLRFSRRVVQRPRDPHGLAERVRHGLAAVHPGWGGLSQASCWALGNWALDLACLVAAFVAVGAPVPWRALPLAYGAAQLAANLPITPGGLGVVEGSLTIGLVAFGGSEPGDVGAVIVYRLISFWGLLLVGWAVAGALALLDRRTVAAQRAPEARR